MLYMEEVALNGKLYILVVGLDHALAINYSIDSRQFA